MEGKMIHKVTPEYFADTKKIMRWTTNKRTARKTGLSLKTVLQIRGSKTYLEYVEQKRAQHPEVKYSAQQDLFAYLKERCEQAGVQYKTPSHMSIALYQLRQMDKVSNNNNIIGE